MTYEIRPIKRDEIPLLQDFLYEAVYQKDENNPTPRSIIEEPEISVYIKDFGANKDDYCLVAESEGALVGAVWTRILFAPVKGFGNLDMQTPEFAISMNKAYRGKGIGTQLMKQMLNLLREKGYAQASLSVQKGNYAVSMYCKVGFSILEENAEDYIMVCDLVGEE